MKIILFLILISVFAVQAVKTDDIESEVQDSNSIKQELLEKFIKLEENIKEELDHIKTVQQEVFKKYEFLERILNVEYQKNVTKKLEKCRNNGFVKEGSHYYYFENDKPLNYTDAKKRCQSMDSELLEKIEDVKSMEDFRNDIFYWLKEEFFINSEQICSNARYDDGFYTGLNSECYNEHYYICVK